MTEVLSRPTTISPEDEPEISQTEHAQEADAADNREVVLSPVASRVREAAERIASHLDNRAQRKADKTAQDEVFATYADNVATTRDRIREERIDLAEEKIEQGKQAVTRIGRSAIGKLKNAGLITVGLSLMAGEAAGKKVKAGHDAVVGAKFHFDARRQSKAFQREYAKEVKAFDKASLKEAKLRDKQEAKDIKSAAKEDVKFEREMDKKARVEARQERARQRAEAASARREARRQKWMEVKYVAIGTKELTKDAIKARKQKLGRFAARARAAGVAATDTWKNYK